MGTARHNYGRLRLRPDGAGPVSRKVYNIVPKLAGEVLESGRPMLVKLS